MNRGSPAKHPWSRPALYSSDLRGEASTWEMSGKWKHLEETWQRIVEEKRRQRSWYRGIARVDKWWFIFFSSKSFVFIMLRRSGSINGSLSLLLHISLCLCFSALLILVLCLHGSTGKGRWRGENYAQWDTWRKQFEIEMKTTLPPPSQNSFRTYSVSPAHMSQSLLNTHTHIVLSWRTLIHMMHSLALYPNLIITAQCLTWTIIQTLTSTLTQKQVLSNRIFEVMRTD